MLWDHLRGPWPAASSLADNVGGVDWLGKSRTLSAEAKRVGFVSRPGQKTKVFLHAVFRVEGRASRGACVSQRGLHELENR